MDIPGYVNPRSLGNNEPAEALHTDLFIDQALWDKHIAHADPRVRDLYTWDATFAAICRIRAQPHLIDAGQPGVTFTAAIGEHDSLWLRVFIHNKFHALCLDLAKNRPAPFVAPSRAKLNNAQLRAFDFSAVRVAVVLEDTAKQVTRNATAQHLTFQRTLPPPAAHLSPVRIFAAPETVGALLSLNDLAKHITDIQFGDVTLAVYA